MTPSACAEYGPFNGYMGSSGRFEAIWSDQLLVAAVIEPLRAVSGSTDATNGFSDAKLA